LAHARSDHAIGETGTAYRGSSQLVDDFTRECLALVADTSLSGARVARELDAIVALRGKLLGVVSYNGTELTSTSILRWSQERHVESHHIAPGKPTQNAFVESFSRSSSPRHAPSLGCGCSPGS
jgi:transposase InsO family protein